jgi:hypothetical protein
MGKEGCEYHCEQLGHGCMLARHLRLQIEHHQFNDRHNKLDSDDFISMINKTIRLTKEMRCECLWDVKMACREAESLVRSTKFT